MATRKRLSRKVKVVAKDDPLLQEALAAEKQAFVEEHGERKGQVDACYSTAGDKYRLTLVNISAVENWFKPSEAPKPVKKKQVLLVFCQQHCKLSDIDGEGMWRRDVTYKTSDGGTQFFKQGTSAGALLRGWREARAQFEDPSLLEEIDVWGQPKAWTDEIIASWTVDFVADEYGQSLVFADCLSSQWTPAVCLKAWLRGIIWAPMAPDVTSYLQEPDTHEHNQLKAILRRVKVELHLALELEYKNKVASRPNLKYPSTWGPYECLYVVCEGLRRFKRQHPLVPLQGLQENQMLRVRPSPQGTLELVTGLEPWSCAIEPGRTIPPSFATRRDDIVRNWPSNEPPEPEWATLDNHLWQEDFAPAERPAEEDFVVDLAFEHLELTEHQKHMLMPPEERIKQLVFPASLQNRIRHHRTSRNKSRWAAKFQGHFVGKATQAWRKRLRESGGKQHLVELSGGTAKARNQPRTLTSTLPKLKRSLRAGKALRKASSKSSLVEVAESPWHGKVVRVHAEGQYEGRAGKVQSVSQVVGVEPVEYTLNVLADAGGDKAGGVIVVSAKDVEEERTDAAKPSAFKNDWRRLRGEHRVRLASELNISHTELGVSGVTLEIGTVHAFLSEVELRCTVERAMIVPPSLCATLASPALEIEYDLGGEMAKFVGAAETARYLLFVLWSEAPQHYTFLRFDRHEREPPSIQFKDSLRTKPAAARLAATRVLRKLGLISQHEDGSRGQQFDVPERRVELWPLGHEVGRAGVAGAPRRGAAAPAEPQGRAGARQRVCDQAEGSLRPRAQGPRQGQARAESQGVH